MGERDRLSRSEEVGMRSGTRVSFEVIARNSSMIRDNLRRLKVPECDQSDVMQEILLSAWRTVEAGGLYVSERLSIKKAVRHWLFVVTWHHITHYREHQHQWEKGRASYTHPAMDGYMPPPSEQVEARLSLRGLERLDPPLRDAVANSALGYTAQEIAAEHGQNPNTIQHRLERGRKQLRRAHRLKDAPTLLALRSMLATMAPLRLLNRYS
ncbi:sigma-70 family RNA polymerase sigma factor [Sorangium sp. So ce341]|uniref:sigma-70 family RNA polymerase sigma factor n=1 Tax=Sorangium sp. So ce341 TaxID=3133302 RepID=UPI003F5E5C93